MRFACHAANLLGTVKLVVSGVVGNAPSTSDLALDSFEIEQDVWPADGSSTGIDKYFTQEQYLTPALQLETQPNRKLTIGFVPFVARRKQGTVLSTAAVRSNCKTKILGFGR